MGQTIRQHIIESRLKGTEQRLQKLIEMDAPEIMIKAHREMLTNLQNGIIKVAHLEEYGDLEFSKLEVKTGRGGKKFGTYVVETGIVYFFPEGKYGPFCSFKTWEELKEK